MREQKIQPMDKRIVLTPTESASFVIIKNELRFIFTIASNDQRLQSNYIASSLPYIGIIVDGAEDWLSACDQKYKTGLKDLLFTKEEETYYAKMRAPIKLWDTSYDDIYHRLEAAYKDSDAFFSSICKPFAKQLKLYDTYGVDVVDGKYCGNTILCNIFAPDFNFNADDGERIKRMSIFAGRYVRVFDAKTEYLLNNKTEFHTIDYGGYRKPPMIKTFEEWFVLFSLLCQINFILKCIDEFILEETTIKLRFAYILYYYIVGMLPKINTKLSTNFMIDSTWYNDEFRNCMAHYKLGKALTETEMVFDDPFYGLTQKYLGTDYYTVKQAVMRALASLAEQIEHYLRIEKEVKVYD